MGRLHTYLLITLKFDRNIFTHARVNSNVWKCQPSTYLGAVIAAYVKNTLTRMGGPNQGRHECVPNCSRLYLRTYPVGREVRVNVCVCFCAGASATVSNSPLAIASVRMRNARLGRPSNHVHVSARAHVPRCNSTCALAHVRTHVRTYARSHVRQRCQERPCGDDANVYGATCHGRK